MDVGFAFILAALFVQETSSPNKENFGSFIDIVILWINHRSTVIFRIYPERNLPKTARARSSHNKIDVLGNNLFLNSFNKCDRLHR